MSIEDIKERAAREHLSESEIRDLVENEIGVLDYDDDLYCEEIARDIYSSTSYISEEEEEECESPATEDLSNLSPIEQLERLSKLDLSPTVEYFKQLAKECMELSKQNRAIERKEKREEAKKKLDRNIKLDKSSCKIKVSKTKKK